jgi:predicted nucleic acid-binding protein
MIILDSDVLSALMQEQPNPTVQQWVKSQSVRRLYLTSISVFEIQRGISLLPDGHRKLRLGSAFAVIVTSEFQNRILSFDRTAARMAAELSAQRKLNGINVGVQDTLIAGIALAYDATIATGNVKDFRDLGARVVNPWVLVSGR